jgi:asparagine synthase (glutamine-hydrolysing)
MATQLSTEPLRSFTLTFADSSYDESAAARRAAECLGTIHQEVPVSSASLVEAFSRFVEVFDEPLNDPASLVMLTLAQAASGSVKVALTGDGGDELLMGYPHVLAHSYVERVPASVRGQLRLANPLLRAVPSSQGYFSLGFKTQRLARGLGTSDLVERELAWRGAFTLAHARSLLTDDFMAGVSTDVGLEHFRRVATGSPLSGGALDTWSWLNLRSYLLDTVLVKVDRATMAHGVEARSPLLDRRVVELALGIPVRFKTGAWKQKRMLREILHRVSTVIQEARGKHGMGVPVGQLLHGPLRPALMDYASESYLARQGIFDPTAVRDLLSRYFAGRQELRKEAWGFLVFQAWFDRWGSSGG